VIRKEIEPLNLPLFASANPIAAATNAAIPPFMSTAPRPKSTPSATSPENGPCFQRGFVAGRHHVGVAGEARCGPVPSREEVFDRRACPARRR
jgi:hypothetical protein